MTPEFRAWDKKNEIYLYNVQYAYDTLSGFVKYDDGKNATYDESCFGDFLDNKRYDTEQFTGLKDVNGNKIFEGDIVSISNHPFQKHKGDLTGINIEGNYEINWGERDLTWLAGMWRCSETRQYLTVIGNVHENPELLEVEK